MAIPTYPSTRVALKGRKGLIVGIANDQSIAWGVRRRFVPSAQIWLSHI
jgi:enoyl-[acyl-carrier protein] reductase I